MLDADFLALPLELQLRELATALRSRDVRALLVLCASARDHAPLCWLCEQLLGEPSRLLASAEGRSFFARFLIDLPETAVHRVLLTLLPLRTGRALLGEILLAALAQAPLSKLSALCLIDRALKNHFPALRDPWIEQGVAQVAQHLAAAAPSPIPQSLLLHVPGRAIAALTQRAAQSGPAVLMRFEAQRRELARQAIAVLGEAPKAVSQANAEELLARRVYTDPGHFLIELLQNAEDAGARTFRVVFDRARILVWHDGSPFDVRDLVGVTSIGQTTKRKQQIGFFGVGFKSVYEVTERPQVYSDVYEFEIADVSVPRMLLRRPDALPPELAPELVDKGTLLVLPLRQPDDALRSARALYRKAKGLDPCVLLTLRSIAVIDLWLTAAAEKGRGERYSIKEEPVATSGLGGDPGGSASGEVAIRQSPEGWLRRYAIADDEFVYDAGVRDPVRPDRSRVMVGVLLDERGVPQPLADEAATVYSYLPTSERSGLRLFIQGHFDVPVDRERVTPESPWNRWLMTKVPVQLAALARRLLAPGAAVEPGAVARGLLAVLPLSRELTSPLFRLIPAWLGPALSTVAILPCTDGKLHPPAEVVSAAPALARLFDGEPLSTAVLPARDAAAGSAARPAWLYFLDPELAPRSVEVARALGCAELAAADLPEVLTALLARVPDGAPLPPSMPAFLRQPPASLLPLYDLLLSEVQELERAGRVQKSAELVGRLRGLPLLPDESGRLHRAVPAGSDALAPCFAAPAVRRAYSGQYVFIHPAFEAQPGAGEGAALGRGREFLQALGASRLGVEQLAAQTRREDLGAMLRLHRLLAAIADEIPQRARRVLAQQPVWPDATGWGRPLIGPDAAYLAPDPQLRALFPGLPLLHAEVAAWPHARELGASLQVQKVIAALHPDAAPPLRIEPTLDNIDRLQALLAARRAELVAAFPPELGADGSPRSPALSALPLWRTISGRLVAADHAVWGDQVPALLPAGSPEAEELAAVLLRPSDAVRLQALAPLFAVEAEAAWLARLVQARARPGEPLAAQPRFLSHPRALAAVVEQLMQRPGGSELVVPLLDARGILTCCLLSALSDADAPTRALVSGPWSAAATAADEPAAQLISAELRDALTPELRARLSVLPARSILVRLQAADRSSDKPGDKVGDPLRSKFHHQLGDGSAARSGSPDEAGRRVETHPVLGSSERRHALYQFLLARQHDLFADPKACELLLHSRLFPSSRGILRAPSELVYEGGLPDLGLDWSPSAEIPAAVLALLARHLGTGRPSLPQLRRGLERLQFLPVERRTGAALGVAALLGRMSAEVAAWADELPLSRMPWALDQLGRLRRPRELYLPTPELEALVGTAPELYADPRLPGLLGEAVGAAGFRRASDVQLADVVRHLEQCCAQGKPLPPAVYKWMEEGLSAGTLDGADLARELEPRRWVYTDDGTYWNHRQVIGAQAPQYFGSRRGYFSRGAAELPLLCRLFHIPTEVTTDTLVAFLIELGTDVARAAGSGAAFPGAGTDALIPITEEALPRRLLGCYAWLGKSGVGVPRNLPLILCTQRGQAAPRAADAFVPPELSDEEPERPAGLLSASAPALYRSDTPLLESLFAAAGRLRLTVRGPREAQADIDRFYDLLAIPRLREVYTVEADSAIGADVTSQYRQAIDRLLGALQALLAVLPRVAAQRKQLTRTAWVFEPRLRALLESGGHGIRALRPLGVRYALPGVGQVRAEQAAVYSPARGELLIDAAALLEPLVHLSGLTQGLLPCIYDGQQQEQLADIIEILLPLWTAERMHAYLDRRHFPAVDPGGEAAWPMGRSQSLSAAEPSSANELSELPSGGLIAAASADRSPPIIPLDPEQRAAADAAAAFRELRAEIYREAEQREPLAQDPARVLQIGPMKTRPEDLAALAELTSQRSGGALYDGSLAFPSSSVSSGNTSGSYSAGSDVRVDSAHARLEQALPAASPPPSPRLSPSPPSGAAGPGGRSVAAGERSEPADFRRPAPASTPAAAAWHSLHVMSDPLLCPPPIAPAAAPAAGLWQRLRSLITGSGGSADALERPIGWGQGSSFGVQSGIAAQLWATPEVLSDLRAQPPSAQLRFEPGRLPSPYLYAVHSLGVVFNPLTQTWEDPDAVDPWSVVQRSDLPPTGRLVQFEGVLAPGDNLLPLPLFARLSGRVQLFGHSDAAHSRVGPAGPGRLVVQVAGSEPLRVRYQAALREAPSLTHSEDLPSLPSQWLQPTLHRKQLPEEVQDFLRTQKRQHRSAWTRALAVQSFVQWRYRYDRHMLGRPEVRAARQRLHTGQGHHHLELLHLTGDDAALGYGSCYELNVLIVELLRHLGVAALAASCWVLDEARIDSPDHLVALAILASSAGPCPLPLDASVGPAGPRRALASSRPELPLPPVGPLADPLTGPMTEVTTAAPTASAQPPIAAVPGPWSAGASSAAARSLAAVLDSARAEEDQREAQTAELLLQALERVSERLGRRQRDVAALATLSPAQRSVVLRLRLRELLGGDHLIGPLLAVLRGELAQVEALTPELEELSTLGVIATRPLRLYQITFPPPAGAASE